MELVNSKKGNEFERQMDKTVPLTKLTKKEEAQMTSRCQVETPGRAKPPTETEIKRRSWLEE